MNLSLPVLGFLDYLIIAGIMFAVCLVTRPSLDRREMREMSGRLDVLQRGLEALLRHQGVALPPPPASGLSPEVERLARSGRNKIEAIRLYREQNPGMGLKEAKEAIEAFQERQG